jgi:DNA primase
VKRQWIDFKELKKNLDFATVLEHYGVTFKVKGEQATAHCPLPTHDGDMKSPSFSAQLKKGIWQCFAPGCKAKGNVLDFAVRMEGLSPDNRQDVRQVAIMLSERFRHGTDGTASKPSNRTRRGEDSEAERPTETAKANSSTNGAVVVNQPLDFQLKGLDVKHPYLRDRGFTPQTIDRFGLGYCSRGMLKGRIAIPIHNENDQLVGYAGRLFDESHLSKTNPKYKFPSARERHGVVHEFHKSKLLYNANRILAPATNLIVVEGFASVWWLYQWRFKDAVAIMGCDCSQEQAEIIVSKVSPDGLVLAMPDGNEAGRRCAANVFEAIAGQRAVRWVTLDDDRQPTDCTDEELFRLLGSA